MILIEPPRRMLVSATLASNDPWEGLGLSRVGLARFVARARRAVGLAGEVDVLLSGDAALRRLNRDFRGKDKATDVLSFPSPEEIFAVRAGDLAISLETAARQAKAYGHGLEDEVRILLLHGLLHLSGMDHEVDKGEMAAREAELREQLKLNVGLIARVEEPERGKFGPTTGSVTRRRFPSGMTSKKGDGTRAAGRAPARQAPARQTPARQAPARQTPARQTPARQTPVRQMPVVKAGKKAKRVRRTG